MEELNCFSDTYILIVLTGIDGSSTFETAARTSGYGDSLNLGSAEPSDQSWKGDALDFIIVILQLGGRVLLRRATVGLSIEFGGGITSGRASSALTLEFEGDGAGSGR